MRVEAMLFAAARSDHVEQLIRPALSRGAVVLCDRFMDSSRVYQGITGNLDPAFVEALERVAINGVVPDCTIIFDLPATEGLERARRRAAADESSSPVSGQLDRFEMEEIDTHEKRREAFLDIAAAEPLRCRVVDASQPVETLAARVLDIVEPLLPTLGGRQRREPEKTR